jgi:hypothetical protein
MMDTVARRLLERVSWGMKFRLYLGAGLSILDMVTDIFVIVHYLSSDEEKTRRYGYILIVMITCSLGFLCLMSWVQNHRGSRKVLIRELLFCVSGLKPGVDAARVARGKEKGDWQVVDQVRVGDASDSPLPICPSLALTRTAHEPAQNMELTMTRYVPP